MIHHDLDILHLSRLSSICRKLSFSSCPIVVAMSGGGDSMALATILAAFTKIPWHSGFVQHNLRGNESLRDESFIRSIPDLLKSFPNPPLSFQIMPGIPENGWTGNSLESTARKIRYLQLEHLAKALKSPIVATGHTRNDQAETVMLRLLRGCGINGLGSMRFSRKLGNGIRLVRPLLQFTRQELRELLIKKKVPWLEDSSNSFSAFERNFLRIEVFPVLKARWGSRPEQFFPRIASQARRLNSTVSRLLDKEIASLELPRAGTRIVWHSGKTKSLCHPMLSDCLHRLWVREKWPMSDWSYKKFSRLAAFIRGTGQLEQLPNGWKIYLDTYVIRFDPPEDLS